MLQGGPLEEQFLELGPSQIYPQINPYSRMAQYAPALARRRFRKELERLRRESRVLGPSMIYANTIAVRPGLELLESLDVPVLTHVHELEWMMRRVGDHNVSYLLGRSDRLIAVSESVRSHLIGNQGVDPDRIDLVHEFIPTEIKLEGNLEDRRRLLREELGIPAEAAIVGAVGTLDWRKGSDLFVPLAQSVSRRLGGRPAYFLWIGGPVNTLYDDGMSVRRHEVERAGLSDRVRFLGPRPDVARFVDLLDTFVLTSREDPYPLVFLEAAALGKPIICFGDSGGIPEFVEDDCGFVVPYLDVEAMADWVSELLQNDALRERLGEAARVKVRAQHGVEVSSRRIAGILSALARRDC